MGNGFQGDPEIPLSQAGRLRVCARCVLPETFPGADLDGEGVCSHCRRSDAGKGRRPGEEARFEKKFQDVLGKLASAGDSRLRSHDAVMAYSGGKDSSYTLKALREKYRLRVLAVTFDNGFVSPQAVRNIRAVTEALDVDHLMISPAMRILARAFSRSIDAHRYPMKALERASAICNTCMNLAKMILVRCAIEKEIPLIAYGWSPGQAPIPSSVMRINPSMLRQMQGAMKEYLQGIMGEDLAPFLLAERHFRMLDEAIARYSGAFLYNVHPLAFLPYDEDAILDEIENLGWKAPRDTDTNSTNCLLNAFANQVHIEAYGFHPYAFEIAGLVREGHMSREAGMRKLAEPPDPRTVEDVKGKLGIR